MPATARPCVCTCNMICTAFSRPWWKNDCSTSTTNPIGVKSSLTITTLYSGGDAVFGRATSVTTSSWESRWVWAMDLVYARRSRGQDRQELLKNDAALERGDPRLRATQDQRVHVVRAFVGIDRLEVQQVPDDV